MTEPTPALHELSPRGREIVLDYYASGYAAGLEAGRRQLEDEWDGRMEASAAVARMIAASVPYDELALRRGEPARAARQRQILAERGIWQEAAG